MGCHHSSATLQKNITEARSEGLNIPKIVDQMCRARHAQVPVGYFASLTSIALQEQFGGENAIIDFQYQSFRQTVASSLAREIAVPQSELPAGTPEEMQSVAAKASVEKAKEEVLRLGECLEKFMPSLIAQDWRKSGNAVILQFLDDVEKLQCITDAVRQAEQQVFTNEDIEVIKASLHAPRSPRTRSVPCTRACFSSL